MRRSNSACSFGVGLGQAAFPVACAPCAGLAGGCARRRGCRQESRTAAKSQLKKLARAGDLVCAERRAVRLVGAGLVSARRSRWSSCRRSSSACRNGGPPRWRRRSRPDRGRRYGWRSSREAWKRATWSVLSASETAPSIEMLLLSQKTISLLSLRCPASAMASWLTPSIRQPSPREHIGVVVDEVVAEGGVHDALAEREADRIGEALAERAGRRLDAGGMAVFGMAGGLGAELAEMLDLVDRHVLVAGQIEQRVEQHRAVAGRQDEAVAVGPVRVGGSNFRKRVNSTVAMSAQPMGRPGWPELAFSTASMARKRIALAIRSCLFTRGHRLSPQVGAGGLAAPSERLPRHIAGAALFSQLKPGKPICRVARRRRAVDHGHQR